MKDLLRKLLFGSTSVQAPSMPPSPLQTPSLPSNPGTKNFGEFVSTLPRQPVPPYRRSSFVRDLAYENTPGVREAMAAIDNGDPAILVSGRAGTGKTTLIRYLKNRPGGERQAIVAPTAVAALNARAQTIHSFFQFPPLVLDPDHLPEGKRFGQLMRRMNRLVIDEISMVRVDLLDAMDARLRQVRGDPRPFGGVQVVMVGDFLQLPPVVESEARDILHGLGYETPFAFNSRALRQMGVTAISLEQVFRQEEEDFIQLLGKFREGIDAEQEVERLNDRCFRDHREEAMALLLTPTRAAADHYNQIGLSALSGQSEFYHAKIQGKFDIARDRLPVPELLELRVGSRVLAVQNDPGGRWINGSLGTVTDFNPNGVCVKFDRSHEEYIVGVGVWRKIRQVWNDALQRIEEEEVGSYSQIPLIPAWAMTIHKCQGLTLDDVRVDVGHGTFASGQLYVALSRVRTMDGLSLARRVSPADLRVDPLLRRFMDWAKIN